MPRASPTLCVRPCLEERAGHWLARHMGGTARTIAPCLAMVLFVCADLLHGGVLVAQQRILTGMRPTGPLHLGHYVGALENWLRLQHEYDCYFLIADYQALGDHIDDIERIR